MKVSIEYELSDNFKPKTNDCERYCPVCEEPIYEYCSQTGHEECAYEKMRNEGLLKEV